MSLDGVSGETVYDVEEVEDSGVLVYPFSSEFSTAGDEEYLEQVPFVLRLSQDDQKPHSGYYSPDIDDRELKEAMDSVSEYLEENGLDRAVHLRPDEDGWARDVRTVLGDTREEVTQIDRSARMEDAYTAPHADRVPPSRDDTYSFDASAGWDWD